MKLIHTEALGTSEREFSGWDRCSLLHNNSGTCDLQTIMSTAQLIGNKYTLAFNTRDLSHLCWLQYLKVVAHQRGT